MNDRSFEDGKQLDRETLRNRYLELTNQILPQLAQERKFPVRYNHCFQRIVLDNLFGCCWYERLNRQEGAAYRQLDEAQLKQAIGLAEAIATEPNEFVHQLKRQQPPLAQKNILLSLSQRRIPQSSLMLLARTASAELLNYIGLLLEDLIKSSHTGCKWSIACKTM